MKIQTVLGLPRISPGGRSPSHPRQLDDMLAKANIDEELINNLGDDMYLVNKPPKWAKLLTWALQRELLRFIGGSN